jgi:hypothetical protein
VKIYQNNKVFQWNHTQFTTTTLNGYPAVSTVFTTIRNGQQQNISRLIFLTIGSGLFEVTFSLNQSPSDIGIIEQILSTFTIQAAPTGE